MTQETRKDPRAKVLTMTVRYKSATVDEFIEQYSLDIGRGGIFIKTSSPFAPGTLLKFEIRIAEDRTVLQGVGRVVWKRDPADAGGSRPAGMGVKFIKIDEASRQIIEELVRRHEESGAAYDAGLRESEASAVAAAESTEEAAPAPAPARKATMIGLGGLDAAAVIAAAKAEAEAAEAASEGAEAQEPAQASAGFFPETDSEAEMPPPGERTVMRQAAELLQEALLGAGGTMDEIGAIGSTPLVDETGLGAGLELSKGVTPSIFPPPRSSSSSQSFAAIPADIPSMESVPDAGAATSEGDFAGASAASPSIPPNAEVEAVRARSERPPAKSEPPKSPVPPAIASREPAAPAKSGGGRAALYLGLVAAAAAGLYFAFGSSSKAPSQPEAPAASVAEEKSEPAARAPVEEVEKNEEKSAEELELVQEEASKPAPAPSEKAAPVEIEPAAPTKPAMVPVEKPAPPAPAPKPAVIKTEDTATKKPAEAPAPAPKPAAEKPAPKPAAEVEKPAAAPAPAPVEKPKPAPKPAPVDDENPY